ncbi:ammonium transporter (TC 1.A.11) [Amphibacillus marinus]|uniref:Ammonium transporter n=1 Tax=Amphibacillus marinus TaxID=872970 RepID=A0A1H8JX50_9BACI|nr:ammonium transporter [Amphibacillus marinus]SEN85289.1 ammonium transporter (TC 1.A.11) [Amphibacillus marinus]
MVKKIAFLLIIGLLLASPISANTGEAASVDALNMMWVMLAAFLVFFMHAGFAMVESGFTRAKNSLNIIMKNLLTISIGPIVYFVVGYGIMFGSTAGSFIGADGFFLSGVDDIGFFVFQAMFVATCATIISGAVAERIKIGVYALIVVAMTSFVYPVVGHWIWSDNGWLAELGFSDFAGSTVVHLTGAVGAFTIVKFLGARIGKYSGDQVNVIPGHNIPMGALGVFILWLGWFGFNGGSTLEADPSLVPMVIATTLMSSSAAVISSAIYSKVKFKQLDASLVLNGALAGLVGITAGAAEMSIVGAIVVGLISGVILIEGISFIDAKLKVDDPVGATTVHGICGIWGTIAIGFFSVDTGLFYGYGISQLGIQALGVIAVIAWTTATVGLVTFVISKFTSIRVSSEEEISGLDIAEHGSNAYEFKDTISSKEAVQSDSDFGLADRLNSLSETKATS